MKALGKKEGNDFELVIIGEKGHVSIDIDFRIRTMLDILGFFPKIFINYRACKCQYKDKTNRIKG